LIPFKITFVKPGIVATPAIPALGTLRQESGSPSPDGAIQQDPVSNKNKSFSRHAE
jgi:hypothetical protein